MFDAIHYGTAVYRNELVKRLHRIGYLTRQTAGAFEIEGVDSKFIERFSKRSKERDAAVAKEEKRLGRRLTKNEVAHVVHQTRPKKLKGASDEQVRQQQLGEIGFFEKRLLRKVVASADGRPKEFAQKVGTDEAVEHGLQHVFERNSVAPEHRILEAALVKGRGQLDLAGLKRELAGRPNLVRVGSDCSTREILDKELFLIRTVNAGVQAVDPVANRYEAPDHLGADQRKALAHVITSPDIFTGFRGLAGSGKSTTLVELSRALQDAGFAPVFCAPTASAANTLRKDHLEAVTLAKLLADPTAQSQLSGRSVIVLDEAGAVGLDDMAKLFELVRQNHCRVVFSGDTGQHSSVARGDALRILEQYSSYRFSELTTIRRQKPEAFRQIVELAAAKQTEKAFAKLLELGAVTEALADGPQANLYDKAAQTYLSAVRQGKTALLVSPTWSEIEAVTEKLRKTLKAEGIVGQRDETVAVFDSLSWTVAQKRNVSQYDPGQRLRFIRQTKQFEHGDTVEVVATVENRLRVRRQDGTEANFIPASAAASFDVGEARELKVVVGDWLLLQANHGKEFINGERVQVREIRAGRVALADGRVLPTEFNAFTHGYAVTSHSSQSKTVDEVLLVASSKSFAAVNREQFYVSISRGRERVHVFTDDAELLARRVTDSRERKAAVELQALRDEMAKLGFIRREQPERKMGPATAHQDLRTVRTVRETGRAMRPTRMAPTQRLAQIVADTRRWINERLGIEQKKSVVEKIEQAEKISPDVKETPEQKPRRTFREQARQNIERHRIQQQQQRRSGGIHI
jgi:hypothetical protein